MLPPALVNAAGKLGVSEVELTATVLIPTKASVPPPFKKPTVPMELVPTDEGVKVRSQVLPGTRPVVQAVPGVVLLKVMMVNLVVPVKNTGAAAVPTAPRSVGVTDGNWRVVLAVVGPAPPPPKLIVQVVAETVPLMVKVPESDSAFR